MSVIKDQLIEVANILEEYELDIIQYEETLDFELLNKDGVVLLTDIADFNELHSALLGFVEGYKAAVQFYKVVRY